MSERREAFAGGALLVLAVLFLAASPVRDLDTWWHLAAGRLIAASGIPHSDPFSFVLAGRPWVSFEWLSELLFWAAWRTGGAAPLVLLCGAFSAAGYLMAWRSSGARSLWGAVMFGLAAAAARPWLVARPFVFDLTGIGLSALLLSDRAEGGLPRRAALLPVVAAVWANLHGAAGLIVSAMAASAAIQAGRGPWRRWTLLTGVCAAAVLANPHGWGVLEAAWRTALYPGKELLKEWNAPWFELRGPLGAWALAALGAIPRAWKNRSPWALWTLGALGAALWAQRSVPLFLLCAPACVAAAFPPPGPWRGAGSAARLAAAALLLGASSAAAVILSPRGAKGFGLRAEVPLAGAAGFLREESVAGPLFNEYESGGPLIFHGTKVFIDGRNAEYPAEHFRSALSWHRPEVWARLESRWGFTAAALRRHPTGAWTSRVLDESPSWRLVYWDDEAMVYLKDSPANAERIRRLGYRLLQPGRGTNQWVEEALGRPGQGGALAAELARSTRAAPGSVNAGVLSAYALARLGRLGEASAEARRVAAMVPGEPQPLFTLGWVLETAGDGAGAEEAYRRALALVARPARAGVGADVLNNLGRLAQKRGDHAAAALLYRKALSWNPGQGDAMANLRRLEGL
ncbi:MAG: hypothetical protein HY928_03635 [Elusimicrobia bacterium]|nr:hypothetical protein [Elusimicrobiota bacterium]